MRRHLSDRRGKIERMFGAVSDVELVEVMGKATRDESTAIAQRLAAVAELFVRRSGGLAERATVEWSGDQPGYLPGFGILPADSVRELVGSATLTQVVIPSRPPEPGYRPSGRAVTGR